MMCTKDELVAEDRFGYTLNFEFSDVGKVRFTSTVAAFENADYTLQQADDQWSNNVVDEVVTVSEGAGGGITDSDNDGEPDSTDNCPNSANANQTDTDNDDEGDACDTDDDGDEDCSIDADNCPARYKCQAKPIPMTMVRAMPATPMMMTTRCSTARTIAP